MGLLVSGDAYGLAHALEGVDFTHQLELIGGLKAYLCTVLVIKNQLNCGLRLDQTIA